MAKHGVILDVLMVVVLVLLFFCMSLAQEPRFFRESSFEEIMDKVKSSKVIYLGETHTSKRDHELQLRVLQALKDSGVDFVLLMEAFQIPFQEHIDDYINCWIDEREMIELTEYKRRWRFDTKLYSPLWRFAKENSVPLYALNIPSELLREVRKKGLENVISNYLPPKAVRPNKEYEDFLIDMLGKHKKDIDRNRFLEIQTAWDNGMAYRILKIMLAHPDKKLVVIVGKGHLFKGYGIPYVLSKWSGVSQSVLYSTEEGFYFLFSIDFSKESSSDTSMREPN